MKWITPLSSDPIGWSEKLAKTRLRLFICTFIHIALVFFGLLSIYYLSNKLSNVFRTLDEQMAKELADNKIVSFIPFMGGGILIMAIGAFFPAMYLYAMHRLLKIIREREQSKSQDNPIQP
jgi:TRAP-type C4-dicarboxylate transport system permease small subunit